MAGTLLRQWRQRRRRSQLDLALDAGISARHLSFVETGRASASRAVWLKLAECLELPLRERNALLHAAGLAPVFGERSLDAPDLAPAREAIQRLLRSHDPYPAIAVDRRWNLLFSNRAADRMLDGVDRSLLEQPINVLRLSLHPQGLAPAIINFRAWRDYLLQRLQGLVASSGDAELGALVDELAAYPDVADGQDDGDSLSPCADIYVTLRLRSPSGELALFSTLTVFGSPLDVTLSEFAIEAFFPADTATAERLRQLAASD